jgi:hypothetical protein
MCDHGGRQKLSECTPLRLPELPTWSWASIDCPVVWDNRHNTRIRPEAKVVHIITSEGNVFSIDSLRRTPGFMPPFDVDNRFARLIMTGKAQQVVVREFLPRTGPRSCLQGFWSQCRVRKGSLERDVLESTTDRN